jgi:hypothetical protein
MAETTIDILEGTMTCDEIAGLIVGATREALVTWDTDKTIDEALEYCLKDAGLPEVGDTLTINGQTIVLERRRPRLTDKRKAIVTIEYRRQEFSDPDDPPGSDITYSGGTALRQLSTQLDIGGAQITVTHNGVTQGGTVDALGPHSTLRASIIEATNSPGVTTLLWAGFVNQALWNGGPPGTWLCTSVTFEPADTTTTPKRWRMNYEFEFQREGWDPDIIFTDPETGEPPPDLVLGEGYKTVTVYPTKSFSSKFPG